MACSFGWDWGPDLQTAGLWKPVRVERWRVARLAAVRPLATLDADGTGRLAAHVDVERSGLRRRLRSPCGPVSAGADAAVTVPADRKRGGRQLEVPHAPVWWPVGHGEQPLSELIVDLAGPGGRRRSTAGRSASVSAP